MHLDGSQAVDGDLTTPSLVSVELSAYKGRKPSFTRAAYETVVNLLGKSASVSEIAQASGLSRQTVYRIKENPAAAEKALALWSL